MIPVQKKKKKKKKTNKQTKKHILRCEWLHGSSYNKFSDILLAFSAAISYYVYNSVLDTYSRFY